MSELLAPGRAVETPDGSGMVMNVVRSPGNVTTFLVQLDADGDRPTWREYEPNQLTTK